MFNFGSMFSQIRSASGPSLSQLLEAPSTTLVRLLDDDNFISDFRSGTNQIREYMTYKRMQEMVDLITAVGDPSDKKRSFKCPLTAADLLSCEAAFVFDKLLPERGVVVQEENIVTTQERQVEQEAEDEDDDELQISSSEEGSKEEKNEDREAKSEDKTCGEDEEEFGDFVATPVRPKKIVKIKEVVQTVNVVKKEYPALVDKIFQYFDSKINFTLTSYCCKVLTSLLNKRTSKFLDKLFENQRHTASIFKHIQSRSTVQFLTRVFTIEVSDHLEFRVLLFKKLLKQSSIPHELDTISNISATLCETFQKINTNSKSINPCKQLQVYFSCIPQMLEQAVTNIISQNETVSTYTVPFIYQLLNSLPAELDNDDIGITLYKFVERAIIKLKEVVAQKKNRLGVGRVKMIEVLNFILKRTKIQEYLSQQQDFFALLFSIITLYPLNNILHNEAFKLITMALAPDHASLLESLLSKEKLINWLFEEAQQERQRLSSERPKTPKGFRAHLLNFCKKLKEASFSNPAVLQLINDPRFAQVYNVFVEKVIVLNDQNLGGYASHKTAKFQIMTSKEQILKYHATFLANARPAIFEVDPEDEFQNPILLEELQRQLDGIEFQNKDESRPQAVIQQQKHKAELIEENQHHKSAFWKVHMDYDVDELMHEVV